jgi:hypothetical protein
MFEGHIIMDIKELKKELKKIRIPEMDISMSKANNLENFIHRIKKQDRDDEKYMLHNKIFPISIVLIFFTILILISPARTILQMTGIFLIYSGLVSTLIFLLMDYKIISQESYDLSLCVFLRHKEARLKSWHSTPAKYQWTFTIFVSGLIMLIVGSTSLLSDFSTEYAILFIAVYLLLLLISWIIGEYLYRKRHKKRHLPLLNTIAQLRAELDENNSNT